MVVALTGANGHVGAAVCRHLLEEGHEVRALVYRDDTALRGLPVTLVHGPLTDAPTLQRLCAGAEVVQHLAAQISIGGVPEKQLWQTNVSGTQQLLSACQLAGVRRFVYFSSIHAYRAVPPDRVFDENAQPATEFPYERSKAAAQALVLAANGEYGMETLCLNPTAVLGPWDFKPSLQGQMLLDLLQRRIPVLTPGGFDWVDNRDIALAAAAALTAGKPGEAHLLSGQFATMIDLAALLGRISGQTMPRHTVPFWLLKSITPVLAGWSALTGRQALFTREALSHVERGHPRVSAAKAVRELGYRPRPLEETVRDTYHWFTKQGKFATS